MNVTATASAPAGKVILRPKRVTGQGLGASKPRLSGLRAPCEACGRDAFIGKFRNYPAHARDIWTGERYMRLCSIECEKEIQPKLAEEVRLRLEKIRPNTDKRRSLRCSTEAHNA